VKTRHALAWLSPGLPPSAQKISALDQLSSMLKSIDIGRVIVEIFVFWKKT
jgi:hypothetical protein